MSKVYNKIVQSNTEPSKNDIWLKDGQMKTFGKEGWKPVGGKTTESYSPHYVLEYTEEPNAYKDKYEELLSIFTNQSNGESQYPNIILAYYPERYSGGYSKLDYYRVLNDKIDLVFNIHEDYRSSHSDHPFIGKIKITITSRYSNVEKIPHSESYILEYNDEDNIGIEKTLEICSALDNNIPVLLKIGDSVINPMIIHEPGSLDVDMIYPDPNRFDRLVGFSIEGYDYSVYKVKFQLTQLTE